MCCVQSSGVLYSAERRRKGKSPKTEKRKVRVTKITRIAQSSCVQVDDHTLHVFDVTVRSHALHTLRSVSSTCLFWTSSQCFKALLLLNAVFPMKMLMH
jgi:hypothetical protein